MSSGLQVISSNVPLLFQVQSTLMWNFAIGFSNSFYWKQIPLLSLKLFIQNLPTFEPNLGLVLCHI